MLTNILAGLSLILALATGGLWGRSYWVYEGVFNERGPGKEIHIISYPGQLVVHSRGQDIPWAGGRGWFRWDRERKEGEPYANRGFHYKNEVYSDGRQITISFPHWSLLLALSVLPALRGSQLLRARRR